MLNPLKTPATRLVALEPNTASVPSADRSTPWLMPLPWLPPVATDTFSVPGSSALALEGTMNIVDSNAKPAASAPTLVNWCMRHLN